MVLKKSPSHTVGLERKTVQEIIDLAVYKLSASHAVGFKTYKLVKGLVETLLRESPSHTVGLEPW